MTNQVSSAPVELQITEIIYDSELPQIEITFNSRPGAIYAIDFSTNLKDAVKKRSPERQPQTNNYISPYKQQNLSPSKEKNQDKKKEYAYQSPYRQRSTHPPVVQISQRNDAFFSNDY